jgi:hypothetical protein
MFFLPLSDRNVEIKMQKNVAGEKKVFTLKWNKVQASSRAMIEVRARAGGSD